MTVEQESQNVIFSDDARVRWAIDQCLEIEALCDIVPDRAKRFSDSVREKTFGMRSWIMMNRKVSLKQMDAIRNMKGAIYRWMR